MSTVLHRWTQAKARRIARRLLVFSRDVFLPSDACYYPPMISLILIGAITVAASPSGQIAYVSGTEQEDHCVMVLDVATHASTRVGMGKRDGAPVWSPDGQWLAFTFVDGGKTHLRVVRADGSQGRTLKTSAALNRWPRWSPDSSRLVYSSGEGFGARVAVYDLAKNTETIWGGGKTGLLEPVWFNRDTVVAVMMAGPPGHFTTEMATVSATGVTPFPQNYYPSSGKYVEWSIEPAPKGRMLAFDSNDGGDREIFVLSQRRGAYDVSNHRAADWNPKWSPDAKWLAFESFRGGRRGVYRVFVDTARVFPVAVGKDSDDWAPSWSPDGRYLTFVSDRTGDPEIYLTAADGKSKPVRLTNHPGDDYAPAWRPKGKRK